MLGRMGANVPPLRTARLRLEPVTAALAKAILAGDLSGVSAAPGWPHEHTTSGLAHAVQASHPLGWLITTAGQVIGDAGTHGAPDQRGCVEIGYGLAAPYRGQGFGSEAVAAMTAWLLSQPDIARVRACTAAGNMASRRVLEKAGYRLISHDKGECVYEYRR
jgi:RimJ/RimL family protein N-acetyltransferase